MSNLSIYPISAQAWRKSLAEIRRSGNRAYLARDCSRVERRAPLFGAYAIATGKPAEAVYVRKAIGIIEKGTANQMLLTGRVRKRAPRSENPYKAGDRVVIARGAFAELRAEVLETRGRTCLIAHELIGKTHTQAISYTQLRPG